MGLGQFSILDFGFWIDPAYCLLPTVYCENGGWGLGRFRILDFGFWIDPAYCLLPTVYCENGCWGLGSREWGWDNFRFWIDRAYCQLPTVLPQCPAPGFLLTAYCLLPTAYCLLPTAYCLLPTVLPQSLLSRTKPPACRAESGSARSESILGLRPRGVFSSHA